MSSWNASSYLSFEAERSRPARDLVAAIPLAEPASAVDLGCGPGNSTELLRARFPAATLSGIDSAPGMIDAARTRLPGVSFELGGIEDWRPAAPVDVILSNAALHWVADHDRLLPRLVGHLGHGGVLAIQMPDNLAEPSHVLMREIAASGPWAQRLRGAADSRTAVQDAASYFRLLRATCERIDIWRTIYHHPLDGGADGVVDWFTSTGLRPFLDPLGTGERADYLDRYRTAIGHAYPPEPDGTVLLPFPRLFIVATRR